MGMLEVIITNSICLYHSTTKTSIDFVYCNFDLRQGRLQPTAQSCTMQHGRQRKNLRGLGNKPTNCRLKVSSYRTYWRRAWSLSTFDAKELFNRADAPDFKLSSGTLKHTEEEIASSLAGLSSSVIVFHAVYRGGMGG